MLISMPKNWTIDSPLPRAPPVTRDALLVLLRQPHNVGWPDGTCTAIPTEQVGAFQRGTTVAAEDRARLHGRPGRCLAFGLPGGEGFTDRRRRTGGPRGG